MRVYFLDRKGAMQETGLRFMEAKMDAAMGIEGRFSSEGLRAMGGAKYPARAVLRGLKGIDGTEAIWSRMCQQAEALVENDNETAGC
ncbi:MAG: hypothetical protein M0031_09700 [Thermaerobacter sp.]|nr:hypothetical protein [Thermaerobacter sp.]